MGMGDDGWRNTFGKNTLTTYLRKQKHCYKLNYWIHRIHCKYKEDCTSKWCTCRKNIRKNVYILRVIVLIAVKVPAVCKGVKMFEYSGS